MLNVRSLVLGNTPIRTTSATLEKRRKRLFTTPAPSTPATPFPTTSDNLDNQNSTTPRSNAVTINARTGTMVTHRSDALRSNYTGVVLRKTAGSPTTLDVLWTNDGVTTINLPADLILINESTSRDIPDINSDSADLDFSNTSRDPAPPLVSFSSRGYRPLFTTKLPKNLRHSCPLDSVSTTEIENFQIAMDNYLSQGHPRVRLLITG